MLHSFDASLLRRALMMIDAMIPDAAALEGDALRQRRLFVVASSLVATFGLFFAVESARVEGTLLAVNVLSLLVGALLGLGNVVIGQRRWPARTGAVLVVLMLAVLTSVAVTSPGGLWDASLWWQVLIPMIAAFLVSARFAALAAAFVIGEIVLLYLGTTEPVLGEDASHFRMLSATTVVFTVTALAWAYELARKDASAKLEGALLEIQQTNAQLGTLAKALEDARDHAQADSTSKSDFLTLMRETAREQGEAIDETSAAMAQMAATFRTVKESVETLARAAENSGGAVRQINTQSESSAQQVSEMVLSVEEAAASLEEMSFSVREVAESVSRLSSIAEQTSSAMNQMQGSITHVAENARKSERLAAEVKVDAEKGAEAVGLTRDGVQNILALSKMAGETIRGLSERIRAIDQILDVINEVAEQTQLLSLNAAIIASQAGRHGKGFAVVAGEIKKLAERTAHSTKDIAQVIGGVQEESRRAVQAINDGESAVLEGLGRSRDAEHALLQILSSAEETTTMVSSIVAATEQQAAAAREVAVAMEQVAQTAAGVAAATGEQTRGAQMLLDATQRLQVLAREVEDAGREQRAGGHQVEAAVEEVHRMVQQLSRVQDDQARGGEQIHRALEAIGRTQEQQIESIARLDSEE